MYRVKALYDFEAQPGSSELSIYTGQVLKVTRQDVGDGWWEGTNEHGEHGLFPEGYVEILADSPPPPTQVAPPAMPPPPLPAGFGDSPTSPQQSYMNIAPVNSQPQRVQSQEEDPFDGFDSDLEDENSTLRAQLEPQSDPDLAGLNGHSSGRHGYEDPEDYDSDEEQSSVAQSSGGASMGQRGQAQVSRTMSAGVSASGNATTMKRSFNRSNSLYSTMRHKFSNFVKSGTEAYILNTNKVNSYSSEHYEIIISPDGPRWKSNNPYNCVVDKPKKESKLKGIKSFISYQITPTFNGIQVSRRYKHFDWLHERLEEKFTLSPIPPLPEKQVSGKFEDDLIEHRKQILQIWMDKICRHPVINQSEVWMHFITCTDEKKWKEGKRKAEKDVFTGGSFFHSVGVPQQPLDQMDVCNKSEQFARTCKSLDDSVRTLYERTNDMSKKMAGVYRRDYEKFGLAFDNLANSFLLDDGGTENEKVTEAVRETAAAYHTIGDLYENQTKNDMEPFMDALYTYKGLLSAVPAITDVHKSAVGKLREQERLAEEDRASHSETEAVRRRVDTISYVMLAEMAHFRDERRTDFKQSMTSLINNQIDFYQNIIAQLQRASNKFSSV